MSIVQIIGKHVKLTEHQKFFSKKPTNTWYGLCPFHEEQTPSFTVDGNRKTWRCFGCGKGGDLVDFMDLVIKKSEQGRQETEDVT